MSRTSTVYQKGQEKASPDDRNKVMEWGGTFTPMWDCLLVHDFINASDAMVYGTVWRFCQMESEKCWASYRRMARFLGISRSTVRRSLGKLTKLGLLDKQSTRLGKPNIYRLTDIIKKYQLWHYVMKLDFDKEFEGQLTRKQLRGGYVDRFVWGIEVPIVEVCMPSEEIVEFLDSSRLLDVHFAMCILYMTEKDHADISISYRCPFRL